jgi:hypothetical protein
MAGCAPTQTGVAKMMAHIKAVDGVTRVSLSKSEAAAATGATNAAAGPASCKGDAPATFSLVIFFEKAKALDAYGSSGAAVASASVPVPNAVNQANGAAGTAAADGAAAAGSDSGTAPAGTDAPAAQEPQASTSTTTSTTTGGTP